MKRGREDLFDFVKRVDSYPYSLFAWIREAAVLSCCRFNLGREVCGVLATLAHRGSCFAGTGRKG